MDENARWGFGVFVTIFLAVGGAIFAAFGRLRKTISTSSKDIHIRIDEVKRDYVRRDDLAIHMGSLEKALSLKTEQLTEEVTNLRDDMREQNKAVLAALTARPS